METPRLTCTTSPKFVVKGALISPEQSEKTPSVSDALGETHEKSSDKEKEQEDFYISRGG